MGEEKEAMYTAAVRTIAARLSLSLFPSVHYKEHIVSSFKLPDSKLFFFSFFFLPFLCACACVFACVGVR